MTGKSIKEMGPMAILKRTGSVLFIGAATAGVIGLSAAPAVAATWTVKPGGSVAATSGKATLTDTHSGVSLSCASSKGAGTVKSGSGLSGTGIGSITSLAFTSCTGPAGLTFTVTNSHFPWSLNAVSFNSTSGVTTGTLTGIHATLTGPSCSAVVDGTGATADNGMVSVTYTNSTGALKVLTTGGNLHIYSVSGCFGLIHSGDPATFSGTYAVSPKQTITSP
jgi:hypothetical protein